MQGDEDCPPLQQRHVEEGRRPIRLQRDPVDRQKQRFSLERGHLVRSSAQNTPPGMPLFFGGIFLFRLFDLIICVEIIVLFIGLTLA